MEFKDIPKQAITSVSKVPKLQNTSHLTIHEPVSVEALQKVNSYAELNSSCEVHMALHNADLLS